MARFEQPQTSVTAHQEGTDSIEWDKVEVGEVRATDVALGVRFHVTLDVWFVDTREHDLLPILAGSGPVWSN